MILIIKSTVFISNYFYYVLTNGLHREKFVINLHEYDNNMRSRYETNY